MSRTRSRDIVAAAETMSDPDPSPERVVADADVLVADLFVDGASRAALDHLRRHSWTTLVASDALLADAEAAIAELGGASLAADWRDRVEAWREPVDHREGDHPALGSAVGAGAMHLLTLDDRLVGPETGVGLRRYATVSVRTPAAFATVFDPEALHESVVGGEYPGPDRDERG